MNVGDLVRMRGKSVRGISQIEQYGNHWRIAEIITDRVLLATYENNKDLRWVDLPEDKDFQIMESWTPASAMNESPQDSIEKVEKSLQDHWDARERRKREL